MSTTEDVAKLKLETTGEENLKRAADTFDRVGAAAKRAAPEVYEFADSYEFAETSIGEFAAAQARVKAATETTTVAVTAQGVAVAKTKDQLRAAKAEMDAAQGKTRNLTAAAMQASNAFQDFSTAGGNLSQKIGSVSNNLGLMVTQLGGYTPQAMAAGAAIQGLATVAALAAPWIGRMIEEMRSDKVEGFATRIEELKARVKELSEKEIKLAVDVTAIESAQAMLDHLTAAQKAFDDLGKLRSKAEAESGAKVKEMVAETPGGAGALRQRLVDDQAERNKAQSAALQDAQKGAAERKARIAELDRAAGEEGRTGTELDNIAAARKLVKADLDAATAKVRALTATAEEQARTAIGDEFKGAFEGDRDAQWKLRDRLGRRGGADAALGMQMAGVAPDVITTKAEAKAKADAEKEAVKQAMLASRDVEAAQKKAAELQEGAMGEEQRAQDMTDDVAKAKRKAQADADKKTDAVRKEAERGEKKDAAAEAKKIEDALGKTMQGAFEYHLGQNNARIANGVRVVHGDAEERRVKATGAEYALPPEVMAQRLQGQMMAMMQARNATPEAAALATKQIVEKAQTDLAQRAVAISGQNLGLQGETLALTRELTNAYGRMAQQVAAMGQELANQQRQVRFTKRTARNH